MACGGAGRPLGAEHDGRGLADGGGALADEWAYTTWHKWAKNSWHLFRTDKNAQKANGERNNKSIIFLTVCILGLLRSCSVATSQELRLGLQVYVLCRVY